MRVAATRAPFMPAIRSCRPPVVCHLLAIRAAGLLVLLCGFLAAPAVAQVPGEPAADDESATISTDSNAARDDAIAGRIRSIFAQMEDLDAVEVEVREGVVSLGGSASNDKQAERAVDLAGRLAGVVAVQDNIKRTLDLEDNVTPFLQGLQDTANQWMRAMPLVLLAIGIFVIVAYAGHRLANWPALWERIAPNPFLAELLAQTFRVASILFGLLIVLNIFGATAWTGTILGGAGVIGIAIGFAVRDTLENYIASIMLSIRQPFRAHDHVVINEHEGKVARLTSRATVLLTLDGNHLRIPNSTVFKAVILNYTRNPERRFEFELGVDANDDPMAAIKSGLEAIAGLEFVLNDPAPIGNIVTVGDSNIVLCFRAWVDQDETDYLKARSLAIRAAKDILEQSGFTLPEPIYRLRLDSMPPADSAWSAAMSGELTQEETSEATGTAPRQTAGETSADDAEDVRPERHLDEKVSEERAADAEADLLDETKPTE